MDHPATPEDQPLLPAPDEPQPLLSAPPKPPVAPGPALPSGDALLFDLYRRSIRNEAQNEEILRELARASDSRKKLYTAVETVQAGFSALSAKVDRIVPLVDIHEAHRQRRIGVFKVAEYGAKHLSKAAWIAAVAVAGWFASQFAEIGAWFAKFKIGG